MKKLKKFFDEDNRLNKGYDTKSEFSNNKTILHKNFVNILPPLDVILEYEEIYPGTLQKIIKIAEKEQENQHNYEIKFLESQQKVQFYNKIAICIAIAIFSITTIILSNISLKLAIIFVISSCISAVFLKFISCAMGKNINNNKKLQNNFNLKNSYGKNNT